MPMSSASASPLVPTPHQGRSYWQVLTRAAPVAACIHAAFAVVFQGLGAGPLVLGNAVFVLLWCCVYWLLTQQHNKFAISLIWFIIPAHALLATDVLGWGSGFHYYVMLMMPLMFVSPGKGVAGKVMLGLALTSFYIALDYHARQHLPAHHIGDMALLLVGWFNMATTFAVLAYLAHIYFGVVGKAEAQLRSLATTDALTGLANRRRILDVASYEIMRGRRDGTPLCFVLCDVDHFKRINDSHGHEVGDQVLVSLAQVLQSAVREVDTVARWGGEEFLVVLPDTTLAAAQRVAERARWAIECADWPTDRHVTMTFGVSQLRDGETLAEAVARADEALYRGKADGRNRSVLERPAVQPNSLPSSSARR